MQRFVLGLFALVVLAGGFFLLWILPAGRVSGPAASTPGTPAAVPTETTPVAPTADEAALAPDPAAETPTAGLAPTGAESESGSQRRVAEEEGEALVGRVLLPEGVPDEEELAVLVLTEEPSRNDLLELLDPLHDAEAEETLHAVAAVGPTGEFETTAPLDAESVWLALRGQFVYADGAREVVLADEAPIELAALLGGRVTGLLIPPADATEEQLESLGDEVRLEPNLTGAMGMGAIGYSGPRPREVRADPTGDYKYEFNGVAPAEGYKLRVRPDLLAAFAGEPFEVRAGQEVFVDVPIAYGGTLVGRVVDQDGRPVAGADLDVEQDPLFFGAGGFEVRSNGESGADGSFRLEAVAAGKSKIIAEREGYLDSELRVELAEGQVLDGLELVIDNGERIAGTVFWPDGSPVADVRVNVGFDASYLGGMEAFNAMRGAEGRSRTEADGTFAVTGLGKGPFTVQVRARRAVVDSDSEDPVVSTPAADDSEATEEDDDDPYWVARADGVRPGTEGLVLTLEPPLGVGGQVIDDLGQPVAKFRVVARTVSGGMLAGLGAESHSDDFEDDEGVFFLSGLRAGQWEIFPQGEGFGLAEPQRLTLPLADDQPLTLVLERAASVSGVVVDPDGSPVAGAEVTQAPSLEDLGMLAMEGYSLPETVADENGAFVLEGLTAGNVRLRASAEEFATSSVVPVDVMPGATTADVVLTLRAGGRILGIIYGDDGEPLAHQMILCQNPIDPTTQAWETSDDDGEFIFDRVAPGSYQVMTMPSSGGPDGDGLGAMAQLLEQMKFTMAEVVEGEDTEVTLGGVPEEAVRVSGRVTIDGDPVTDVALTFFADGDDRLDSFKFVSTDADGRYSTELGKPGGYMINVQQIVGTGQQQSVEFFETVPETEEVHELDLDLPIGGIAGTVRGPDGEPAPNTRVTLGIDGPIANGSFTGGNYSEIWTDAEGRYSLKWLRPGTYSVAAGGAFLGGMFGEGDETFGRQVRRGLAVSEGQRLEGVDFDLDAPGTLRGRVVAPDGQPIAEAAIFLRDEDGNSVDRITFVQTDGAGAFNYTGLEPGTYQVTARTGTQVSGAPVLARVKAGEEAEVSLTIDAGTLVFVTLTDKAGDDVRCDLEVIGPDGEQVNGLWSLSDLMQAIQSGAVSSREQRVGPLSPGTYKLIATGADGKSAKKTITLSGQAERRVRLRLK